MAAPTYMSDVDADLVRLIKDGAIFLRDVGATAPTGADWTPGAGDHLIGYYSEDGFVLTPTPGDTTDFNGHNGDPVISDQAPGYWTVGFSGLEGREGTVEAYFDVDVAADGSITITTAAASKRYDLVLVGLDQKDRLILVHLPNVQISEREAVTFNRTTLLALGMTFRTFRGASATPYHFKAWGFVADEAEDEGSEG